MRMVASPLVFTAVAGSVIVAALPPALVLAVALIATAVALTPIVCWTVEATTDRRPRRVGVAVTLAASLAWALAGWPLDPVLVPLTVPLAGWGCALGLIDLTCHRLPDVLVLTAYPPVGTVLVGSGIGSGEPEALLRAALAGAAALGVYGLAAVSGGIGFGDAKLAGLLGLVLGWVSWPTVLAAGLLTVGLAAVVALWTWMRQGRGARFAFGPPMLVAALLAPSY